jgi:hypothetical protein
MLIQFGIQLIGEDERLCRLIGEDERLRPFEAYLGHHVHLCQQVQSICQLTEQKCLSNAHKWPRDTQAARKVHTSTYRRCQDITGKRGGVLGREACQWSISFLFL